MSPKDPRSLAIRLSAWLQEEIAAQHRLDAMLDPSSDAPDPAPTDPSAGRSWVQAEHAASKLPPRAVNGADVIDLGAFRRRTGT